MPSRIPAAQNWGNRCFSRLLVRSVFLCFVLRVACLLAHLPVSSSSEMIGLRVKERPVLGNHPQQPAPTTYAAIRLRRRLARSSIQSVPSQFCPLHISPSNAAPQNKPEPRFRLLQSSTMSSSSVANKFSCNSGCFYSFIRKHTLMFSMSFSPHGSITIR